MSYSAIEEPADNDSFLLTIRSYKARKNPMIHFFLLLRFQNKNEKYNNIDSFQTFTTWFLLAFTFYRAIENRITIIHSFSPVYLTEQWKTWWYWYIPSHHYMYVIRSNAKPDKPNTKSKRSVEHTDVFHFQHLQE